MMAWTCPGPHCLPGQGRPKGSTLFHAVGTAKAKGSDGCTPLCVLSVFLSAQIRLPLCTFPCKQQFLTANISQKPEPALSLPPFFPLSLSSVYEAEGKCLISCLIAWVIGRHTQLSK